MASVDQRTDTMTTVDTLLDAVSWRPEDDEEDSERQKTPEPEQEAEPEPDPEIVAIVSRYSALCKQLGVRPSKRFIKQIGRGIVCLCSEQFDRKEMRAICTTLMSQGCSCIYAFDLSGNTLGLHEIGYLTQLLEQNSGIRRLTLSKNCISRDCIKAITQMIVQTNTVDMLNLSCNNITDNESKYIAKMMTEATELRELSLSHNELRDEGGANIGKAMASKSSIEELDLSWNHLRCKGAENISKGLSNNMTITTLNLAWNGFGYEGCAALARALHVNRTLVELDLTSNRIHTPALLELTKGLVLNNTLEILKLGSNPIPSVATTPFLSRLKAAPHMALTILDLSKIIVDTDFEPMVADIREFRPDFCVIYDHSLPINKDKYKKDFDPKVVLNVDPVRLLYYTKKNLRIIDFFNKIDKDRNYTLSRDEIRKAMEGDNITLSSSALDTIMDYIDVNKDGEIDLKEFSEAERRFKRMTHQTLKKKEEQARKDEAAGKLLSPLSFSTTYKPDVAKVMLESTLPANGSAPVSPPAKPPGDKPVVKPARIQLPQKSKSPSTP